jgi:hypothetical protein
MGLTLSRFPADDDPIPEGSQNEHACAFSSVPSEKSVVNIFALKGSFNSDCVMFVCLAIPSDIDNFSLETKPYYGLVP